MPQTISQSKSWHILLPSFVNEQLENQIYLMYNEENQQTPTLEKLEPADIWQFWHDKWLHIFFVSQVSILPP